MYLGNLDINNLHGMVLPSMVTLQGSRDIIHYAHTRINDRGHSKLAITYLIENLGLLAHNRPGTMSFNDLSPEVIHLIFRFLPWPCLRAISLVCRYWRIIAFPLLHHTIGLVNRRCGMDFIKRALEESSTGENTQLQICSSVRRLYVDLQVTMAPKDLADFGQAVSKMTKLESLRWDVSYTDDWHTVLGLWHRSLPELWSLSLVISADDWGFSPVRFCPSIFIPAGV